MRWILILAINCFLFSCANSDSHIPFVDGSVDQWDWTKLSQSEGQTLFQMGIVDPPFDQYEIIHAFWSDENGSRSLRIIKGANLPDLDAFESTDYEGYSIRHYPDEELYACQSEEFVLLSTSLLSIEAALDIRESGLELRQTDTLVVPHYSWRETHPQALKQGGQRPFYSYFFPLDTRLQTQLDYRPDCDCPKSELLGLVPYDARRIRIMPEPGLCYASFSIGRENYIIAQLASLQATIGNSKRETFGPFEITLVEQQARVNLNDDWMLECSDLFAAQSFLERLTAGSSQLDRLELQQILSAHPNFQYLRKWNRRNNTRELAEQTANWWLGTCNGQQSIQWQEFVTDEVIEEQPTELIREFSFSGEIKALFLNAIQATVSVQLADGRILSGSPAENANWLEVGSSSDDLLGPVLKWGADHYAWQTQNGWHDSYFPTIDIPAAIGATPVYLEALDEIVIFLPDTSGQVHAIRKDGSQLKGWEQSLPLGPAEVPILHTPGVTFDHFFHLDTAGVLSVFDIRAKLVAQHQTAEYSTNPLMLDWDASKELVYLFDQSPQALCSFSSASAEEMNYLLDRERDLPDTGFITSDLPLVFGPKNRTVLAVDGQTLLLYELELDL